MSNGMAFAPNSEGLRSTPVLRADFTYSIMPNTISITDTNLGKLSVTNDIEAILRRIEYLYQGSVAAFKIMYRDSDGIWDGFGGTAKAHRSLPCGKRMSKKRTRNCCRNPGTRRTGFWLNKAIDRAEGLLQ
jgi:hypothetical protein